MNFFRKPRWSPYAVGALIGVLSWITFFFMDKALGTSTTFVNVSGALTGLVSEDYVRANAYLSKHLVGKPAIDWQAALVFSLLLGAWVAARLSAVRTGVALPTVWQEFKGFSPWKRRFYGFLGGFLVLYGARMAGGCTSGHCISGGLQLAVSSWVFTAALFISGIVVARLFYRKQKI